MGLHQLLIILIAVVTVCKARHVSVAHCDMVRDLVAEVPDDRMTASSYLEADTSRKTGNHFPWGARLHSHVAAGAWIPGWGKTVGEWIQVEFDSSKTVLAVHTQGRGAESDPRSHHWVQSYTMTYSLDGQKWTTFADNSGGAKVFAGNVDRDSIVTHSWYLEGHSPITAKFVRIYPQSYHGVVALRFGIIGCD